MISTLVVPWTGAARRSAAARTPSCTTPRRPGRGRRPGPAGCPHRRASARPRPRSLLRCVLRMTLLRRAHVGPSLVGVVGSSGCRRAVRRAGRRSRPDRVRGEPRQGRTRGGRGAAGAAGLERRAGAGRARAAAVRGAGGPPAGRGRTRSTTAMPMRNTAAGTTTQSRIQKRVTPQGRPTPHGCSASTLPPYFSETV